MLVLTLLEYPMGDLEKAIDDLAHNPRGVKFSELSKVLDEWFGESRTTGSHRIYRTPWQGDPRLNIQNAKGMAKAYQVRQAIRALRKLGEPRDARTAGDTRTQTDD